MSRSASRAASNTSRRSFGWSLGSRPSPATVGPATRAAYACACPQLVADRLAIGDELGTIIDDLFGVTASKQHTGAVGLLTEGFVSRTDAFADLVAMACAPLLRPDLYPHGGND
jgi:non-canonical (house-cleaning) NTP pyrophosphatase